MICYLNGKIIQKHIEFIILDVNGVGYEVLLPTNTLADLPSENTMLELYISTYIREDSFRLYGFLTMFDKQVFQALLDVSGIGPKVALALLSAINGFELCELILLHQTSSLTKIPGIGAKTAERLVLELKTKCQKLLSRFKEQQLFATNNLEKTKQPQKSSFLEGKHLLEDLNSALLNMGYKEKQLIPIISPLEKRIKYGEAFVFEDVLKDSLKKLSEHILKG